MQRSNSIIPTPLKLIEASRGGWIYKRSTPLCKYAVTKLSKIQTKYGARIVAELNAEYVVFLPARLLKVLEEDPTTLEKMQEAASARRLQLRYLAGPYNNVEFKYVC